MPDHKLLMWRRQVYLFGAVVTSWSQPSGDEVLYVRPDAKFDKSKPISGGIPHCFPQVRTQFLLTMPTARSHYSGHDKAGAHACQN
jgi:D-hexose-6-phosphate mutarotase